jgi:hypothetical protein
MVAPRREVGEIRHDQSAGRGEHAHPDREREDPPVVRGELQRAGAGDDEQRGDQDRAHDLDRDDDRERQEDEERRLERRRRQPHRARLLLVEGEEQELLLEEQQEHEGRHARGP